MQDIQTIRIHIDVACRARSWQGVQDVDVELRDELGHLEALRELLSGAKHEIT